MSSADQEASLAQILDEAERMSRLVHELLTLARADAGQHLAHEPVGLGPLVREVYRQAAVMASGSGGADVRLGEIAEVTALGDRDHLKQLVLILVENALKYTPTGEVRVELTADEREARLVVSDTGLGISPADLPHIFERFYRADRARGSSGTGLGLAIARWIVEEHQGTIAVASEVGRGSIFTIGLVRLAPLEGAEPARAGLPD
jgi:signal transduction histidine kinase